MIEDNEINRQERLLLVDEFPNPLVLSRESESDYYQGNITLRNITSNYVIFKVYFSKKTIFSSSPSMHFIKPLSSIDTTVKYLEKTVEKTHKPIKMLIAVHQIEKVISSKEEAREIFNQKREDKTANQEITVIIKISTDLKTIDQTLSQNSKNDTIGTEDINCEDLPTALGIEKMETINANYKAIIDSKQKSIGILESQLENLGRNKLLFQSKEKALTKTETSDKGNKKKSLNQTTLLIFLLISLIIGGFLSKVKNKFFQEE